MKEMSPEIKQCFNSLPQNVKTLIAESNVKINSVEELKKLADTFMCNNKGVENSKQ